MGFPVLWLVLGCCAYGCLALVGLGSSDLDFRVFRGGRGVICGGWIWCGWSFYFGCCIVVLVMVALGLVGG